MQRSWIYGFSWEPCFRNLSSKKFFVTEIFAKHRRHAAFVRQRGGPKIMQRECIRDAPGAGRGKTLSKVKRGQNKNFARVLPCFYLQNPPRRVMIFSQSTFLRFFFPFLIFFCAVQRNLRHPSLTTVHSTWLLLYDALSSTQLLTLWQSPAAWVKKTGVWQCNLSVTQVSVLTRAGL